MYTSKNISWYLCTCLLLIAFIGLPMVSNAQRDSSKRTTININSSYKPVLRNAVKINFGAQPVKADSTLPTLEYNIPVQNLSFQFQPIPVNEIPLKQDSSVNLGVRNFIKAGYGNLSTIYVSSGFGFGNGKKYLAGLYADYISSKGKITYQDYSKLSIKATGNYFMPKYEAYANASYSLQDNYLYGYDHTIYKYKRQDTLHNQLQEISLTSGIRNSVIGEYRMSYNPTVELNYFTSKDKMTENSLIVTVPVKKEFGENFAVIVDAKADITNYQTKWLVPSKINRFNNVYQVAPSLTYTSPYFTINGGIAPTWDNGTFIWLPNVYAEVPIPGKVVVLQAGWVGRYTKNTYRNLTAINPYLQRLTTQQNTSEIEYYGGVKVKLGQHFNINGKAGLIRYNNLPFFINDTANDSKSFLISNESTVNNMRLHGDMSYTIQDKFSLTAGITINGYTGMQNNARAWHTVPLEVTGSLRWWAYKQVLLKADVYIFGGSPYVAKGNTNGYLRPATDLSAGVEFKVSKKFSAWLDVNNILNDKYQRWHNYEVYGLNLVGGLKINF